eukprot:SAG22_NODE_496_length_9797_cov_4.177241_6_plen_80_part_00
MHAWLHGLQLPVQPRRAPGGLSPLPALPSPPHIINGHTTDKMAAPNLYSVGSVPDIDGNEVNLSSFEGKVVVVVNVACE